MSSNNLLWQRDDLVLHCAHFVVSPSLIEPLHGHTYIMRIEAKGPRNKSDMIIDFLDLKPIVKGIIENFSYTVIIPLENPLMEVFHNEEKVEVKVKQKEYSFPRQSVSLLPISNSTVECISEYFTELISREIKTKYPDLKQLKVSVGEYSKSVATSVDLY